MRSYFITRVLLCPMMALCASRQLTFLKDMETNSDSDSKADSVIEAKHSVRFQADFRKEKFKGFYSNTQKTIIGESSIDEFEENQKLKEEKDEIEDDPQFLFEEVLDEITKNPGPVKKEIAVTKKKESGFLILINMTYKATNSCLKPESFSI